MTARLIAVGLLICAAIVGVKAWESHLIAKGDARGAARVQADWDTQENARNAATARDNATMRIPRDGGHDSTLMADSVPA